ncbi:restriction endonuclease subunit S [Acinetobacter baumannii]|nr:restriction endonuclease subunit S [Acinetobacter baumannii]
MSDWFKCTLGEFVYFQRGHDLPKTQMQMGKFPVAGSNGIIGYHNLATTKGPGITIGRSGNIGTPKFYKDDFWAHNTVLYVKNFNGNHPLFAYYFLKTIDFIGFNTGSAVPTLNRNHIHELEINIPTLPEQKVIASVLSSLDDKIDFLHGQNKTLEAMAETLFRQWFIEDESINDVAINELIEFNPKRTLAKGTQATYLEMAGLSTQNFNATGYYIREFSSGTKFIQQDTLLARITPCLENGKSGYVTFLNENEVGWGSTEYIVMRPKAHLHPLMAYVLTRNQDFRDYAEGCMEGSSGRQRVNVDHLKEYKIGNPSHPVIQKFNDYLKSIESKLIYNSKQIQTLEKLRDTLLPKLMSGEVRVEYKRVDAA